MASDRAAARAPHVRRLMWWRAGGGVPLAALGIAILAACGGDGDRAAKASAGAAGFDTVAAAAKSAADSLSGGAGATGCELKGDWQLCSVEDRLARAGMIIVKRDARPVVPFLHGTSATYGVGDTDDEVDVFVYPSTDARRRDTDALDSATAAPKGQRFDWKGTPTLVTSNNLAAVIRSANERRTERLALALEAGLPPPR